MKTEVPDPARMTAHMKELGVWLGVDVVGITRLLPPHVRPDDVRDGQGPRPPEEIVQDYPHVIICGVQTEHDPANTEGMAGRVSTLEGNFVSFNLAAFIRELGYRASFGGADPGESGGGCRAGAGGSGRAFQGSRDEGVHTPERSHPDRVALGNLIHRCRRGPI